MKIESKENYKGAGTMDSIKQSKSALEVICDFSQMHEQFRLVDPETSEVYTLKDGKAVPSGDEPCYKIWNRTQPCLNCVSRRACRDEKQYIKLEYLGERVLMIVAKPVVVENKKYSLELVSDVTNSMVVQDGMHCDYEHIKIAELIEKVNMLTTHDIFTGLYNNAYIKNKITSMIGRGQTQPFSILIIDIDQFKLVNDHYGHMNGDAVIQGISLLLNDLFREPRCSLGRMGGDEFCIVIENCAQDEAQRLAQQAAAAISEQRYRWSGGEFSVDVSVGAGEYTADEEPYTYIERVDLALYKVKHAKEAIRVVQR